MYVSDFVFTLILILIQISLISVSFYYRRLSFIVISVFLTVILSIVGGSTSRIFSDFSTVSLVYIISIFGCAAYVLIYNYVKGVKDVTNITASRTLSTVRLLAIICIIIVFSIYFGNFIGARG